jgi:lysophospholipase L1-like esterase
MAFTLVLFVGLAGLVEGGARLYIIMRGQDLDAVRKAFAWRQEQRMVGSWPEQDRDYPYLPYVPKVHPPDVELRGLRLISADEVKPPEVFRVFCLGGSTTYLGYPAKLEQALAADFAARGRRLEVVNAADISWTSVETLIYFTVRCVHYQPDAVIVYQGVNDAWASFGPTFRPDYSHWRKRLVANTLFVWDRLPRWLEHSAVFVQVRAWLESRQEHATWALSTMQYVPDFAQDPYHGPGTFHENMLSLLAVARARGIPVLLATEAFNVQVPEQRLVQAVRETNAVTRALADEDHGVALADTAALIPGNYANMYDLCHFRPEGEAALVQAIAEAVRAHLDTWLTVHHAAVASAAPADDDLRPAGVKNP